MASKKIILTVTLTFKRCLIFSTLFEGSAVGVPSLHRFHLQCNCSIFSLFLYMLVVAVLTAFSRVSVIFAGREFKANCSACGSVLIA